MRILFVTVAGSTGNGFAEVMSRQFLREGHRVDISAAEREKESLIKVLGRCGGYDLVFLSGSMFEGSGGWRLKLALWRLRRRCGNLIVDITDSRDSGGRLPEVLYAIKGVTLITARSGDMAEVRGKAVSRVEYVGTPVDMASHDLRRPDFRHTDGKLAIMMADETYSVVLTDIVSRNSRDMILFRAAGRDKERREKIYGLSHVVVCGRGADHPGELGLRAMADGKVALGVGGEAYHRQIGEPRAVFYPGIENPGASDMLMGPDISFGEGYGNDRGDNVASAIASELERVLRLLCEPTLLRDIGLAGREHVRRHHSSEVISSAIMRIIRGNR